MVGQCSAEVVGLDWKTDMAEARRLLGRDRVLQGNVDPMILFAPEVQAWAVQMLWCMCVSPAEAPSCRGSWAAEAAVPLACNALLIGKVVMFSRRKLKPHIDVPPCRMCCGGR